MADGAGRPGLRVLAIEDNAVNMKLLRYLLRSRDHTVLIAAAGLTGVELALSEQPDLILCDVHLPDILGTEVARRLKADPRTRHIPVVAVTARAMVGDRESILSAGFDGYISKPIEPESFVQTIEGFATERTDRPAPCLEPSLVGPG